MSGLTVAEVLERAADLIEPEGAWMQRAYGQPGGGCYCAVGAIRAVLGILSAANAEEWFEDHVTPLIDKRPGAFTDWNDRKGRTQAEVVAKLREAAALARAHPTQEPHHG